ncbi:MAG: MFS transporter [Thaumarchaeota archaeon]|nr:MFS transporter [Nitrososphaerota archaeon]
MKQELAQSEYKYKWLALAVINIGTFIAPLDTGIVAIVLPNIARDFKAHISIAIWVPVIYLIILAAFMTSFGRYSDIKGRKKFYNIGLAIFVAGSFLSGNATDIFQLLLFRIIQAVGGAFLLANGRALIIDSFPPHQRGFAMGTHVTTIYVALSLGPALGGVITDLVGWRTVFFVNVPIGIIMLILTQLKVRERGEPAKVKMDWLGSMLLGFGLALTLLGLTFGPGNNWETKQTFFQFIEGQTLSFSVPIWGLLASGIVLLIAFGIVQLRTKYPVIDLRLLTSNRLFLSSNLTALLMYTAHNSATIMLSFYLQLLRGMDPFEAAIILVALPVTVAIVSPFGGVLSDRVGSRELSAIGMTLITISLALLSFVTASTSVIFIGVALTVLGVGVGLFAAPNTNANLSSVTPDKRSLANGMLGSMRHMGQSLSLVLSVAAIGVFLPENVYSAGGIISVAEYIMGLGNAFRLGAAISAVGIFIALVRGPKAEKE